MKSEPSANTIGRSVRRTVRLAAVPVALSLGACYPGEVTSVQELNVVVTQHDPEFDFSVNATFAMPDSVVHLCDIPELNVTGCVELGRDFDATILARVDANMRALGYVRELDPANNPPDVVILVTAIGSATFSAWVSYPWWGGWGWWPGWGYCPGCYGPGWGWGFPPGGVTVVRYDSGTLFVDMVDPDDADFEEDEIPIPWTGALNGLLTGTVEQRLVDGIDQAFEQSQYLRVGN